MTRFFHGALAMSFCSISLFGCSPTKVAGPPKPAKPVAKPTATPKPTPTPLPGTPWQHKPLPAWAKAQPFGHVPLRPGQKLIALTFDDGPWPQYTREILDVLHDHDVPATFFVLGSNVKNYPKLTRAIRDEGHVIGTHSWSHPSRPRDPRGEIERTNKIIERTVGFSPLLFRPPYGILRNGLAREAKRHGQAVVIWSIDSHDWRHGTSDSIYQTLMRQASRGGIALMHDGGGNRRSTARALPRVIESLRARGYRFVTVPELLQARYVAPKVKKKAPVKTRGQAKHQSTPQRRAPSAATSHTSTNRPTVIS
ncbi:MAG TPA: polysaccharide deacetylase family protein, partial [Abditibacteriaceae bacterium]